jgi:hypothetical protein
MCSICDVIGMENVEESARAMHRITTAIVHRGSNAAGRAGLVVPREGPALADALRQLLTDTVPYDRFRRACSHMAAQLSWTKHPGTQVEVYVRVLKGGNEPR